MKKLKLLIEFEDADGQKYTTNGSGFLPVIGEAKETIVLESMASLGFENKDVEEQELLAKAMHNIISVLSGPKMNDTKAQLKFIKKFNSFQADK